MRLVKTILFAAILIIPAELNAATSTILGWNNLGMHCMDSDYSVFTILPPYNTIEAQLIVGGKLVTNGAGYTVTYQAIADPSGSINTTAIGKGNFYTYTPYLYGALGPDQGLAGWSMPGPANVPQTNIFETLNQPAAGVLTPVNWWRAEGIPLSPYDDALRKNPYPLMRMIAWNSANQPIATNDVVLPVSDEMDCRACHASGTQAAAQPVAGWIWDGLPERDYRLNILRLHDERQFAQHAVTYAGALATNNYNPAGLYRRVADEGKPVLCALCHASEALGTSGYPGVPPLTTSVHSFHSSVMDPASNSPLNSSANRAACYRCHPGSTTRCLRGAMGSAIAPDGSMEMQCQSCHGNMSAVGSSSRVGWFMEPNCQGCHSGTATSNSGQIRYTSVFDAGGAVRVPADQTFATTPNTPPTPLNLSLYRFSVGHGGLQCSACHGSTHAEFPSSHLNDNLRNIALQGHVGVMSECTACHTNSPSTITGGPHGMHPVGSAWVSRHHDALENGQATRAQCQLCHGTDYRGTVLSRMQADRTLSAFGTKTFFRGALIGCYTCHNGPGNDSANSSVAPTVTGVVTNTTNDQSVGIPLPVTGVGATLRIISQAANGSVGLNTNTGVATYFPSQGFIGTDQFTFAAYDGSKNSTLATGTVTVAQGPFSIGVAAYVPSTWPAASPAAFTAVPTVTNNAATVTFDWDFGDGSAHSSNQYATHSYALAGIYNWSVTTTVSGATASASGTITVQTAGGPTYIIATSASPVIGGTTAGYGIYNSGSTVTVLATANTGYVFVNWTENGTPVSTAASYAFTATTNRTLVANYIPTYSIATSASPITGGTTTGDGIYNSGTGVTVVAIANTWFAFVNWTENGTPVSTAASYSFTASADRTLVANFIPTCTITTSSAPANAGSTTGGATVNSGTSVTVVATANAGYAFVNWTENGTPVSTSASYTFTASADRTLAANFVPTCTVITSSAPANSGSTTGGGTVNSGSSLTVVATANAGYAFINWTENGTPVSTTASYTFTASADRTLVANFVPTCTISTSSAPANAGSTAGGGTVNSGTSVTVVATANANYAFVNWTENGTPVSTAASYTFTATANRTLVAKFIPTYTIATSASPVAGGTTTGDGTYTSGSSVTLVATPNAGYAFINWTENGIPVSDSTTNSFTASVNRALVANFVPTFTITASAAPSAGGTSTGGGIYNSGSAVTVVATANAGYAFLNWTENGTPVSSESNYTFTAGADRTLVANFIPTYTITTSASPITGGTTTGDGVYNSGSNVTVAATANAGYAFISWTENGIPVGTSPSNSFTVSADCALVANFTPLLGMLLTSTNSIVISWPAPLPEYVLQEQTELGGPLSWADTTNIVNVVGGQSQVILSSPAGSRFFRLFHP